MQTIERRFVTAEVRCCDDSDAIEGLAISYNALSAPGTLRGFRERIAPGALTRSLKEQDIISCFNHDPSQILGRTSAGTLKLTDTPQGLRFRCTLPNTSYARDLKESIARRDVRGCSFTFFDPTDVWSDKTNPAGPLRTITDMRCVELGPVSAPVYTGTSVDAARAFPMGVPIELRSRLNALGISLPELAVSEEEHRRMVDRWAAAVLAD
jgi:HK97 family phage prohead protease